MSASKDEVVCRDCHRSTALRNDASAPKWRLSSSATDLMMPDGSGLDLLSTARARNEGTEVVVMTLTARPRL